MRGIVLITTLFLAMMLSSQPGQTQQPEEDKPLPNPANYPAAGENCKRRVLVSPWVGTPSVVFTKTARCVLQIISCKGIETYSSGARAEGSGMCDDYWAVHNALANREMCCDGEKCNKKEPVTFWNSRTPSGTAGNLECRVDITICGKVTTEKTTVAYPLDVNSACDVFAGSVAAKYPSEVCCDCANYEKKRCEELRTAARNFHQILRRIRWKLTDAELQRVATYGLAIDEPQERPQCNHRTDPSELDKIRKSFDEWIRSYPQAHHGDTFRADLLSSGMRIRDKLIVAADTACKNCCGGWGGGQHRPPPPIP